MVVHNIGHTETFPESLHQSSAPKLDTNPMRTTCIWHHANLATTAGATAAANTC